MGDERKLNPTAVLGEREDLYLEFKAAAATERPQRIAREVVGMLNGGGGTVWIGVLEYNGIATAIEDVPEHLRRIGALRDHFLDCIEPPPRGTDVTLVPVSADRKTVVRIDVAAGSPERRPFAHVLDHRWRFHVRVGDKLRDMGRDEVRKLFAKAASARESSKTHYDVALAEANAELGHRRNHFLQREPAGMWIGMAMSPPINVPTDTPAVRALLRNPELTGNRDAGWNFANPYLTPRLDAGGVSSELDGDFRCRIDDAGMLDLFVARDNLQWQRDGELYGYVLLEHPVALCRLMRKLLEDHGGQGRRTVVADLALKGIEGWGLRAYSPDAAGHRFGSPNVLEGRDDIFFRAPVEEEVGRFLANPDGLGLRLARQVYRSFGYGAEELPRQADLVAEQLRLS